MSRYLRFRGHANAFTLIAETSLSATSLRVRCRRIFEGFHAVRLVEKIYFPGAARLREWTFRSNEHTAAPLENFHPDSSNQSFEMHVWYMAIVK
jgi:hypothetical protein